MKPLRIILIAFAVLIVAGTIASAASGGVHGKPTPSHAARQAAKAAGTHGNSG